MMPPSPSSSSSSSPPLPSLVWIFLCGLLLGGSISFALMEVRLDSITRIADRPLPFSSRMQSLTPHLRTMRGTAICREQQQQQQQAAAAQQKEEQNTLTKEQPATQTEQTEPGTPSPVPVSPPSDVDDSGSSLTFRDLLMNYEYPSVLLEHPVTTVTAYFTTTGRAKHSLEEYRAWLAHLITYNSQPMVIATSKDFFPFIANLRYKSCLDEWGVAEPQWDAQKGNEQTKEVRTRQNTSVTVRERVRVRVCVPSDVLFDCLSSLSCLPVVLCC